MSVTDPDDWIRHAGTDFSAARLLITTEGLSAIVAFHAQQCAEKALKAVLVSADHDVPRVHDLLALRRLLSIDGLPDDRALHDLSGYAVESRYPDDLPDVTRSEAEEAVETAAAVLAAVRAALRA